jgi:hypothetical protein
MKKLNIKLLRKLGILTMFLMFTYCFVPINSFAQQQYKFKNNETQKAKDIHIDFDRPVKKIPPNPNPNNDPTIQDPSGTFPNCAGGSGTGTNSIDMATGLTGSGVAVGSSVTLTFDFDGTTVPSVKKWYWTKDSLNNGPGDMLGTEKKPKAGIIEFAAATSTGNGKIELIIDNVSDTFNIPPGLTGDLTAVAFQNFVNAIPFALAIRNNNIVKVLHNSFSDNSEGEFSISIVQNDATQQIILNESVQDIPTLTEWGLIILGVILLGVGVVFIVRRKKLMNA